MAEAYDNAVPAGTVMKVLLPVKFHISTIAMIVVKNVFAISVDGRKAKGNWL